MSSIPDVVEIVGARYPDRQHSYPSGATLASTTVMSICQLDVVPYRLHVLRIFWAV